MLTDLSLSLGIVGIGMLVLLLVLTAFAGLIYGLTFLIKDNHDEEEGEAEVGESAPVVETAAPAALKLRAAIIGVALARAAADLGGQSDLQSQDVNTWRTFHRVRRLSQSKPVRR